MYGMYVCLSIRGLCIVYVRTFLACATHGAIANAMEDLEDRRQWQARERVQRYRRLLTAQQRDERLSMNGIGDRWRTAWRRSRETTDHRY